MNKIALTGALAASLSLSACATNPYGYGGGYATDTETGRIATTAAAGAAAGAAIGAVTGGSPVTGALIGGLAGAVIGKFVKNGREYYRSSEGYCYYVDENGQPRYAEMSKCS